MLQQSDRALDRHTSPPDDGERLLVVSNRGPVEHYFGPTGRLGRREAGGGVATALAEAARQAPVTWLAAAASDADRMLAIAGRDVPLSESSRLRYVEIPDEAYHLYYEVFCNPMLWFVQHGLEARLQCTPDSLVVAEAWHQGYVRVNNIFADAIVHRIESGDADRVMLHDYHFYLVARLVRERCPQVTLQQFVHIPWPAPHAWAALPHEMVRDLCAGLLGNDSVVFQTDESVGHFLSTCAIYLKDEAQVTAATGEVRYLGHATNIWSNPISVDVRSLREEVESEGAVSYRERLEAECGVKTIVRVDRLDPSKNVVAGFEAFEQVLENHPEWRRKVRFLAFLVPSRTSIPEYKAYECRTMATVARINARFGDEHWQPIKVYYEHNRLQALVGLTMYDVLLVNSLADGMNLVSKEGVAVNERDGVLVLSEGAGSHEELHCGAICVPPGSTAATAAALDTALRLDARTRRDRAACLRETVERHQLRDWLRLLVKDLAITDYVKALVR